MSTLKFRNRQGALFDIPTVAATQVKNVFGAILDKAVHSGAVAITRYDMPRAMLLSYKEFESLIQARANTLDRLSSEFDDLLERMQSPRAKKAMNAAFNASPAKIGRATVKAARKSR